MTPQAQHLAAAVEEMLLDAGLEQDAELRRALLAVGSLADTPVPVPSGQLAALMGATDCEAWEDVPRHVSDAATGNPVYELGRRRRIRAHRPTVVGLALVAGMGMGVGTVAASSAGPAHTGSPSIQQLLEDWSPAWTIRTPQATSPGVLQPGIDDGGSGARGQDDSNLAGSEAALAEDRPDTTQQQAPPSRQAPAPQPPGQGSAEPGEPREAEGQDEMKEPEKKGAAGAQNPGTGPDRPGPEGSPGDAPSADEKFGQGAGPAPGLLTESGQGAGGQAAGAAAGANPVPGAKWLEKFVR